MYILNGSKREIVNTDFVERLCIAEKTDAALIVASYHTERPPVTLARYANADEAKDALQDLFHAISGSQSYFIMPDSTLYALERTKKDARTKRKGGS